ncbi:CzcE family metal-binding protein [Janthinobacterium aquaticum]|uniref:CzcE family metal-binding protein n=1 Tax=Janthinobacterium sp. FT58W TaxID=2654254 RepID=UPI00126477C0|nr:CzcE family metal-binding protein [Janthinobacterium sp. FT58W]KAB8041212.1 CzcE family metal-binding protein [Janthinobacterium sp. FT58W]
MLFIPRSALAVLCATFAFNAQAAGPSGSAADYGVPATHSAAARSITIDSSTRHINVTRGETITIVRDGQRFTWQVDTYSNRSVFALAEIAPKSMQADGIKVYIAGNPLYAG